MKLQVGKTYHSKRMATAFRVTKVERCQMSGTDQANRPIQWEVDSYFCDMKPDSIVRTDSTGRPALVPNPSEEFHVGVGHLREDEVPDDATEVN